MSVQQIQVKKLFLNATLVVGIFFALPLAAKINGKISRLGNAEQLSLTGLDNWDYKIEKVDKNKIRLKIPQSFQASFINSSKKWTGKYLTKIKVNSKDASLGDSELLLVFKNGVSYFDYLTDQPSNLVIDFYQEKVKVENKQKVSAKKSVVPKKVKNKKSTARKPASTEFIQYDSVAGAIDKLIQGENTSSSLAKKGVFDASDPDYKRFSIQKKEVDYAVIEKNLKENVFVNFPILLESSSQLEKLLAEIPLHVIRSKNKMETKEAQLLHRLYKAKSWAAFNKMHEYFLKTYPESKYNNILRSLATSTYFNVWKLTNNKNFLEKSKKEFLKFQKKLPDSRVAEFWEKIIFYTNLELSNGIEAARIGEGLLKKYPLAADLENIKLSLADSYLKAGQYKRARQLYDQLKSEAKNSEIRKLASFTKPITYIKQKKMNLAVEQYLNSKKEFPVFDEPGYYFNMAEAYFWKGDYLRSANLYKQFIKKYPKHLMNNFAITRVGEIMALMGLPSQRYSPIFFESVYRFGGLKGADIAQIRLHSMSIPKSKKNEADHYIAEIKRIAGKYEGKDMKYFRDIVIADSLTNDKNYLRSNRYLDRAYKENPYNTFASKIKPRILHNIKQQTRVYLDDKDYLSAISLLEKNRKSWLSNVKDLDFKKELARSFEMAGMNDYALAYFVDYATEMGKQKRKVDSQVILSLATLYQKNKNYEKMDKYLKELSISNTLSESDKFKTVKLKFDVYEETAAYDQAEKLLQTYHNSLPSEDKMKIKTSFLLSDFYSDRARFKKALTSIEPLQNSIGEVHPDYYELSKRLAKLYVKNGNDTLAMQKIRNIMNSKPFKQDQSFVFFAGNLFVNNNEYKTGKEVWALIEGKDSIYAKMINEKMKHKKWEKEYGKFVDRIPAMEDSQKGEY